MEQERAEREAEELEQALVETDAAVEVLEVIFDHRRAGWSYSRIAKALKIPIEEVRDLLKVAYELRREEAFETTDDIKNLELARMDHIIASMMPFMEQGDTSAANVIMKVMERRAKFLNLDTKDIDVPLYLFDNDQLQKIAQGTNPLQLLARMTPAQMVAAGQRAMLETAQGDESLDKEFELIEGEVVDDG